LQTLASKVKQAVDIRKALLKDHGFPLELKLAVIQSKIISLEMYGGEWVGMCQTEENKYHTSRSTRPFNWCWALPQIAIYMPQE